MSMTIAESNAVAILLRHLAGHQRAQADQIAWAVHVLNDAAHQALGIHPVDQAQLENATARLMTVKTQQEPV